MRVTVVTLFHTPLIVVFLCLSWTGGVLAQGGDINYLSEIKNIFGGILAVDNVHRRCLQKTLCDEFSDQIVRMTPTSGVNRNGRRILVPTVVQRRGKLRFIGDFIVKMGKVLHDHISSGLYRTRKAKGIGNREFIGGSALNIANANFVTKAINFLFTMVKSIPGSAIISVMDFATDFTNIMNRRGAIYPFVRAATVGYGYGNRRSDNFRGVCSQLAINCRSWWDHIDILNQYDGGTLPREHTLKSQTFDRTGSEINYNDPLTWNQIKVKDLSSPKIFLCKAGKFLEKLSTKMGANEVVRERFGPKDFEESCNPDFSSLRPANFETEDANIIENDDYYNESADYGDIEVLDIGRSYKSDAQDGIDDLPILVFEGLPKPSSVDETEIDFVERLLNSSLGLPHSSVRNAIRLPLRHGERDIVLVEMDTEANEMIVLKKKQSVKELGNKRDIGIRRARFKELWRYVEDLLAIKSSISDINNNNGTIVVQA